MYIVGALAVVLVLVILAIMSGRKIDAEYALGDPEATKLRKQLTWSQWDKVAPVLEATRSSPDLRNFYVQTLTPDPALSTFDEWCEERPNSPEAFLFRGHARIHWAWEARGTASADATSPRQFKEFFRRLDFARQDLERATNMLPTDSVGWCSMLIVARAQQWPLEDERRIFEQAIRCDPLSCSAHRLYLVACTEKWGGSHELMFQVARDASAKAPEGHLLHLLVLNAHTERWLQFDMDGDNADAQSYLQRSDVRDEVQRAYDASLGSPLHEPRKETLFARHDAAYWFWIIRDKVRLAREIDLIGDQINPAEWSFAQFGEFKEAKAWAKA